jgi:hypothetical protein
MAMSALRRHDENQLLANLPAADLERLAAHLQLVKLPLGELL